MSRFLSMALGNLSWAVSTDSFCFVPSHRHLSSRLWSNGISFIYVLSFLVLGVFPLMFKLGYYSLKCIKNILSVILMCSEFRERFWALFHLDGKSNRKSSMSALRHSKRLKYTYFKTRRTVYPLKDGIPQEVRECTRQSDLRAT